MTGIGPEFLKLLRGIEWDSLTARDAVDLRAALKDAVGKSDEWFLKLTQDFTGRLKPAELVPTPLVESPATVESGRPLQVMVSPPESRKPAVRVDSPKLKRKRGRPQPKVKLNGKVSLNRPAPLAIGGADAETQGAPHPAKLFENSYVSKDGPRADIPASLPADHPRLNLHRESSVTPDNDMSDFTQVEQAIQSGRGVKSIFEVR